MLEVVIFLGGSGLGALAMALFSASRLSDVLGERDVLQEAKDSLALSLHAAELARDQATRECQRLAGENIQLTREKGRIEAELVAAQQYAANTVRRDPKAGRMLPNPNAKRPRKSRAKTAPIACG